ncbi:MAG: hypothetical protein RI907_2707 [Pseudomonadota bacterium]|jgi:hypothetical protein
MKLSAAGRLGAVALAWSVLGASAGAWAAPFQPDSVVVLRVGDGVASLGSNAAPTYLDEYSWGGALRQSILLPVTETGNVRLEGPLGLSADGQALVLTGYGSAAGTATTGVAVARQLVEVNAAGAVSTLAVSGVTNRIYGAAALGAGQGAYLYGASGVSAVTAQGTAVRVSTSSARDLAVAGGQLYAAMSLATEGVYAVGTGLPTAIGAALSLVAPLALPAGLALFDLNDQVAGVDTLYAVSLAGGVGADGTGNAGLYKYSKQASGAWSLTGHLAADLWSLEARVEAAGVRLVSASAGGGQLLGWVDTGGWGAMGAGSFTTLATAAARTSFRGASMAPGVVPEPSTWALVVAGVGCSWALRRRRVLNAPAGASAANPERPGR